MLLLLEFLPTKTNSSRGAIVSLLTFGIAGYSCLLYTSDAADALLCVDLGGRRLIKKNNNVDINHHPN